MKVCYFSTVDNIEFEYFLVHKLVYFTIAWLGSAPRFTFESNILRMHISAFAIEVTLKETVSLRSRSNIERQRVVSFWDAFFSKCLHFPLFQLSTNVQQVYLQKKARYR